MKTYLVGGAVRDALLGRPSSDRDWVVVGSTPQELEAQGFLPVGRDFPVFLHPASREEYALARTERKTAPGYRGFAISADPSVTLEEDLARRDLSINAMAVDAQALRSDGSFDASLVIDPFAGRADLEQRILRHVTPAFREDPVRILRLARFAARFPTFEVAPQTLAFMREMVQANEADHLVSERVWQELSRGLMEQRPSRMLQVLRDCGALERLLPEVGSAETAEPVLDMAAQLQLKGQAQAPLPVRFACLALAAGDAKTPLENLARRLRVPVDCLSLARLVTAEHLHLQRSADLDANAVLELLERCDALRQPQRFADALLACECEARVNAASYPPRERLLQALGAVLEVDTAPIAAQAAARGAQGPAIGAAIREARLQRLERLAR